MTTMHVSSVYNVEPSINTAFQTALNAVTLPAWLSQPTIVFDWPEITASLPCFSFVHMTPSMSDNHQGRVDGAGNSTVAASGMLEISAWVSRDQKYNGQDIWVARLRFMESMIASAYASLPVVVIKDYATSPTSPTSAQFRVVMNNLNFVQTASDPNPAIQRKRALITYHWNLRA